MKSATLTGYLQSLSRLCVEVAATPALLPTFLRVLRLVPATVAQLIGD
jgi:hypothetical protein